MLLYIPRRPGPYYTNVQLDRFVKRIFSSKHLRLGKKQNQKVCKAAWGSTDHMRYIMSSSYQYLSDSIVPGVDLRNFFFWFCTLYKNCPLTAHVCTKQSIVLLIDESSFISKLLFTPSNSLTVTVMMG